MVTRLIDRPSPSQSHQTSPCLHSRLIDEVLTKDGKRTGQVRCFECGALFDAPRQGLER